MNLQWLLYFMPYIVKDINDLDIYRWIFIISLYYSSMDVFVGKMYLDYNYSLVFCIMLRKRGNRGNKSLHFNNMSLYILYIVLEINRLIKKTSHDDPDTLNMHMCKDGFITKSLFSRRIKKQLRIACLGIFLDKIYRGIIDTHQI